MEWLTTLLKHLGISRSLVGAIFITSATMLFGPTLFPDTIPVLPAGWLAPTFAAMLLTGCLLVFWVALMGWSMVVAGFRRARKRIAANNLSQDETNILFLMGGNPSKPWNLDNIDYANAPLSRLELGQLLRQLQEKGLVNINEFYEELVSLTEPGRARALQIHKATSSKQ